MPIDPALLLGPLGLTLAALYVIRELWHEHQRADQRDRDKSDAWQALATASETDISRLTAAVESALDIKVPK